MGAQTHAVRLLTPAEWPAWDDFVSIHGCVEQTTWWNEGWLAMAGHLDVIGWYRDGALVGGCLFRSVGVPSVPLSLGTSDGGPVLVDDDVPGAVVRALAGVVEEIGARRRWARVDLVLSPSPAFVRDLTTTLRNRQLRAYTIPSPRLAVVPLAGRSCADIVDGYHRSTRRDLRYGGRKGGAVETLVAPADLAAGYRAIAATAGRRGFGGVRPWPSIERVVLDRVRSGDLLMLGMRDGDDVVAALLVSLVGREGYSIYSGYLDRAAPLRPGHRLRTMAMALSLAAGKDRYSHGLLSQHTRPSTLDVQKLRYGAHEEPVADRLVWERHGVASRVISHPAPRRFLRSRRAAVGRILTRVRR